MTTLEIICLYGLGISLCLLLFDAAGKTLRAAWRRNGRRYGVAASLIGLAVVCTINAQKPGPTPVITVDSFLADAGSYATNDVLHVAVTNAPAYAGIDFSSCPVLVYARPRGLSDAPEWEELLPRRTFSELPADYAIEDATNYNYLVYLDYVPPSPVHTNGVFELRGFVIGEVESGGVESEGVNSPTSSLTYSPTQLMAGFATSTIVDHREIVPIEYLESTGTQWIDTGVPTYVNARMEFGFMLYSTSTRSVFGNLITGNRGVFFGTAANSVVYCNNPREPISPVATLSAYTEYRVVQEGNNITINGIDYSTTSAVDNANSMYLFARRSGSSPDRIINGHVSYFRITLNGVLVRDFQPVRVGRVGYMFDCVSGEYLPFGNKGTGSFVLGPDIKE